MITVRTLYARNTWFATIKKGKRCMRVMIEPGETVADALRRVADDFDQRALTLQGNALFLREAQESMGE